MQNISHVFAAPISQWTNDTDDSSETVLLTYKCCGAVCGLTLLCASKQSAVELALVRVI